MSKIRSPDCAASSGNRSAAYFQTNACFASYKFAFQSVWCFFNGSFVPSLTAFLLLLYFAHSSTHPRGIRIAKSRECVLCGRQRGAHGRFRAENVYSQRGLGKTG